MAVTRVGKNLITLTEELFSNKTSLSTLARRTQGKLGLNKIEDFERFSKACIKELFSLEWIPSRTDDRVGYIKMRPVAGEMIDMMDELRAVPLMRRHKLNKQQAMDVYKVIKRNLTLKRPRVIDFIISNANVSDRPVDVDIFGVWVDEICFKNKQASFNKEEKFEMFKNFTSIRRALKTKRPRAQTPETKEVDPAPTLEEVTSVIENTVEDQSDVVDSDIVEPGNEPDALNDKSTISIDVLDAIHSSIVNAKLVAGDVLDISEENMTVTITEFKGRVHEEDCATRYKEYVEHHLTFEVDGKVTKHVMTSKIKTNDDDSWSFDGAYDMSEVAAD